MDTVRTLAAKSILKFPCGEGGGHFAGDCTMVILECGGSTPLSHPQNIHTLSRFGDFGAKIALAVPGVDCSGDPKRCRATALQSCRPKNGSMRSRAWLRVGLKPPNPGSGIQNPNPGSTRSLDYSNARSNRSAWRQRPVLSSTSISTPQRRTFSIATVNLRGMPSRNRATTGWMSRPMTPS